MKLVFSLTVLLLLAGCTTAAPEPVTQPAQLVVVTAEPVVEGTALAASVDDAQAVAAELGTKLEVLESASESDVAANLAVAIAEQPAVIIGLGDGVLSDFDPAAASNLSQQFLLVGSEAPEPTSNLTAASFRTWEGLYLAGVGAATSGPVTIVAPTGDPYVDAQVRRFTEGAGGSDVTITSGERLDVACDTITHTDVALRESLAAVLAGDTGGVWSFGVAEHAVELDPSCAGARSPEVAHASEQIARGEIVVTDPLYVP